MYKKISFSNVINMHSMNKVSETLPITNTNSSKTYVNSICFCSKNFLCTEKLLYILPCSHIVHEKCFNDWILKHQYKFFDSKSKSPTLHINCPHCLGTITDVLSENKINSKKKYSQYKIDIKSLRLDDMEPIKYTSLPFGMMKLTTFINKLVLVNSQEDILDAVEYIIKVCNIKLNIIDHTKNYPIVIKNNKICWKDKNVKNGQIVIVMNHSHYVDSVIGYYLFRCGFICGDAINHTDIGRIIASKMKLLIFKRGTGSNVVEKMKTYLEEQRRIIIYPEGMITNNQTICQFRTGAFHVGQPVCPVVLKYDKINYADDFQKMMFKMMTADAINVDVHIGELFFPPFDDAKIESVRDYMASMGKLEKSRVSNRSIKE